MAWPPLLAFAGRKKAAWIAGGAALACAAYRYFHWQAYNQIFLDERTEARFDALLVGCIFALLMQSKQVRAWFQRYGGLVLWILVPVLAWHIYRFEFLTPLSESLTIAAMMVSTSVRPSNLAAKVLEWKHLKFLGVISYSLYVWQQGVLFMPLPWLGALFLPAVAIASYGLIERPCLAFGQRFAKLLEHSHGHLPSPISA